MFRVLGLLSLIVVTGCASVAITMKSPGRHEIGSSYSINTSRSWSHIPGPPESWTIDGLALGVLRTWADLKDGDTLFERAEQNIPQFRSEFTVIEVAEMVADTIEALASGADVQTVDFQPIAFGSNDGFRFEISYVQDGLPYRGIAAGTIRGDRLDLLLFTAPTEHYFDLYASEIENIIRSVKTTA
jgi:hypothetical protein